MNRWHPLWRDRLSDRLSNRRRDLRRNRHCSRRRCNRCRQRGDGQRTRPVVWLALGRCRRGGVALGRRLVVPVLGRCDHPQHRCRLRGSGLEGLARAVVQRMARLQGELGLLQRKVGARRRGHAAHRDRALEHLHRRCLARCCGTVHAEQGGRSGCCNGQRGRLGGAMWQGHDGPRHRLRLRKDAGRHRDHRAGHLPVGETVLLITVLLITVVW